MFSRIGDGNGEGRLTITATAEAYPGQIYEGYVERISPTIDPDSGQFRVTGRLSARKGSEAQLLPGMLVRMNIVTDRHPHALVVPKRALRREGERHYVLKLEPGEDGEAIVHVVDIDEGYEDEESVEVVPREAGALASGDLIVLVGNRDLVDGDTVAIDPGSETEAETPGEPQAPEEARQAG